MPLDNFPYLDLSDRIAALLRDGQIRDAIVEYGAESGGTLAQSREFVEDLLSGIPREAIAMTKSTRRQSLIPAYVETVQTAVMKNIDSRSSVGDFPTNLLHRLGHVEADLLRYALGDLGQTFLAFMAVVHKDHPSLCDINGGTLAEGGKVYNRVTETLEMVGFAREKGFKDMPLVIRDWLNRNHDRIQKMMKKPPARFLRRASDRDKARLVAKPKNISLSSVYEKGPQETWDVLPDSLLPYVRMGPGFIKRIAELGAMAEKLKRLGMSSQVNALHNDADNIRDQISEQYNKFVRLRLIDVAVIAAKAMGCQWTRSRRNRITVPVSHFRNPFWVTKRDSENLGNDPYLADIFDRHVLIEANYLQESGGRSPVLSYAPAAYPVAHFPAKKPARVVRILATLDNHPDMDGCPMFDNIWVIVPSVVATPGYSDYYEFHDGERCNKYYDYWDFRRHLDTYLVETQQVFPILLGELRSLKKCYFVGYWA